MTAAQGTAFYIFPKEAGGMRVQVLHRSTFTEL